MVVQRVSLTKLLTNRQPAFQDTLLWMETLSRCFWVLQGWNVGFLSRWKGNKTLCYVALCYAVFWGIASVHCNYVELKNSKEA